MIDSDEILNNFNGEAPIFPLPNFVMFPKTAYSFNIFEDRYKELISDILDQDRFFCTALIKKDDKSEYSDSSEFYDLGTLCYIIEHKKLKNGNYNIIASGLKKVKINEKHTQKLYKVGALDIINDNDFVNKEELKRKKLINKFISLVTSSEDNINLKLIDTSLLSTEMLTNLACLVLPLENLDKQKLLELSDVELRLEVLCQFMDSELKVESDLINFKQIIPTNINWN